MLSSCAQIPATSSRLTCENVLFFPLPKVVAATVPNCTRCWGYPHMGIVRMALANLQLADDHGLHSNAVPSTAA